MDNKNENVEIFDEEEIITLYDENDNAVDFVEVACVEYEENFYALLQPVEPVEGIGEDEVIICKLEPQDDETELITPLTDEDLMEKVFDAYLKAAADGECGCGCGCEGDCDCDCDDDCDCENGDHKCGCGCEDK